MHCLLQLIPFQLECNNPHRQCILLAFHRTLSVLHPYYDNDALHINGSMSISENKEGSPQQKRPPKADNLTSFKSRPSEEFEYRMEPAESSLNGH